jgi:hypothetical protein
MGSKRAAPDDTSQGTDPNAKGPPPGQAPLDGPIAETPPPHTAISNKAPAEGVQTSGLMIPEAQMK